MDRKRSVAAVLMAFTITCIVVGCSRGIPNESGVAEIDRQDSSTSREEIIEDLKQAFRDYQQLFEKRDAASIIGAHDIEFLARRFERPAEEALQALRVEYESYSDRLFEMIADAEIDSVGIAPEEIRIGYEGDADTDLYLIHAADCLWLYHDTPEGWKTLGHDFEGEIAKEFARLGESS